MLHLWLHKSSIRCETSHSLHHMTHPSDDVGILSPTFDNHVKNDHGLWNYLYFIMYLKHKDPTEYSGWHTTDLASRTD